VCCKPADVALCRSLLGGTGVAVGTVVGFPHGSSLGSVKRFETERALDDGATEIDVVLNVGRLRSGDDAWVADELAGVVEACRDRGVVKVILECALLTDDEKVRACGLAVAAGAEYVKTSTGYAAHGATLDDVRLLRASVPAAVKVKAAGGISTLETLLAMLDAGADRSAAPRRPRCSTSWPPGTARRVRPGPGAGRGRARRGCCAAPRTCRRRW
jgi:deoxyribose-phosphate aldolase